MISPNPNTIAFAVATFEQDSVLDIIDILEKDEWEEDAIVWIITYDGWRWALFTALKARLKDASISQTGEII